MNLNLNYSVAQDIKLKDGFVLVRYSDDPERTPHLFKITTYRLDVDEKYYGYLAINLRVPDRWYSVLLSKDIDHATAEDIVKFAYENWYSLEVVTVDSLNIDVASFSETFYNERWRDSELSY